jgi:hypothetical protein
LNFLKPLKNLIAYFKVCAKKSAKYDIVINVNKNSSSGRLSAQLLMPSINSFGAENYFRNIVIMVTLQSTRYMNLDAF